MTEKTEDLIAEARAERDAALAAIERCRGVIASWKSVQASNREQFESGNPGMIVPIDCVGGLLAALDGAPEPDKGCGTCFTCIERVVSAKPFPHNLEYPFIVCAECGNKRCPKAENHVNACTGSNEPGQPGAVRYGGLPVEGEQP